MNMMIRGSLSCMVLLIVWQILCYLMNIPDYLLPSPLKVATSFYYHFAIIRDNTWPTLLELTLGFSLGILTGCLTGGIIASFRPANQFLLPILIISQAIPTFTIAPLIIIWLGYGLSSKVMISVLMIFFPVASAFHDGLQKTPEQWINIARSMGASKWAILKTIRLPAALPDLASGIRIAAVIAPIGAIIGEWIGASKGLGYLMITANARLEIDFMLASLSIIVLLSLMLYYITDLILKKLIWWDVK